MEERKDELVAAINSLLDVGKFRKKDLTSLRGRLHFGEGQLFGRRCFKRMKVISDRASYRSNRALQQQASFS